MSNDQQSGICAGRGEIAVDGASLVWRPAYEVAPHAYRDFQLRLTERRSSRMRLIVPADGFHSRDASGRIGPGTFHYDAPSGGLAVLIASGLDVEDRQKYDTAFLHLRRLRASQTWLKRQFTRGLDFKISEEMRIATGMTSAVPASYDGQELQISDLMQLGREEASRLGASNPADEEIIGFGFFAAAKQDPMPLDKETIAKIPFIVRSAMLDAELAPKDVTDEELQIVTDRYADLVAKRLNKRGDDFDQWLSGPKNSLVRQIADRSLAPGGVLDQKRVAAALSELGWRSLVLSAECIEVQMRCVAADLREPPVGDDLRRFELMYFSQPYLGRLSLSLLAERFHFIREGLFHLMDEPADEVRIGVLLRMLQYYASAVSQRRDLDRRRKQLPADAMLLRSARSGRRQNQREMIPDWEAVEHDFNEDEL